MRRQESSSERLRAIIIEGTSLSTFLPWQTHSHLYESRIASIDFCPPIILSGSSDKHLRFFDITTLQGWSTASEYHSAVIHTSGVNHNPFAFADSNSSVPSGPGSSLNTNGMDDDESTIATFICQACGSSQFDSASMSMLPSFGVKRVRCMHRDLVRTVALGQDFVLSGSYDFSIKVSL